MSEQQILELVGRLAEAELHGDSAAYAELLAPGFAGIGPVGFVLSRDQWAGRYANGLDNEEFAIEKPQVRLYGETAIVTAVQRQKTFARGRETTGAYRITLVAVRSADRWTIANLQLSGPLREPGAPPPFPPDRRAGGEEA